jgi:hypothetical protein
MAVANSVTMKMPIQIHCKMSTDVCGHFGVCKIMYEHPVSFLATINMFCHIKIILNYPVYSFVNGENHTHVDVTFFTQNDLMNNLLKL